jgi:hypothetical protein
MRTRGRKEGGKRKTILKNGRKGMSGESERVGRGKMGNKK